jgi:hypothetical protein
LDLAMQWQAKPRRTKSGNRNTRFYSIFKNPVATWPGKSGKAVFLGFGFVSAQFGSPSPASQMPKEENVRFAHCSQAADFPGVGFFAPAHSACRPPPLANPSRHFPIGSSPKPATSCFPR